MAYRFQVRRDTEENWTSVNPVLLAGEIGAELDTAKWKLGDGVNPWNSLAYAVGAVGATGATGETGETGETGADGIGVPAGGTTGQIMIKVDGTDYNTQWIAHKKSISFYIDDVLKVETNVMSIIIPQTMIITDIRVAVDTAPTGADLILDINLNGTTLYTTQNNRPTIIIDDTSAIAMLPDITSLSLGDKLTLDIDQIGSTVAGENLSVIIICEVG